eukprot:PhF_6_TR6174/c0_g1_i2/m.9234
MLTDVPRLYAHSTFSSPAILNSGYFMSYLRGLTSEECFHHKLAEWVSTYIPPQPSPMIPAVPSPPPPPPLPDSPTSEKESASNTLADAVTNSIHYPGQHPRSETAASEEDIDPLLVYCNPILPKVQKMLQADIEDQYRLFQYVNHSLHNPTQFMSLCPAPINPETKQTMVAMYYDLDPTVSRHFFGKSGNAVDVEDVAVTTRCPVKWVQHQYENVRRVMRVLAQPPTSMTSS